MSDRHEARGSPTLRPGDGESRDETSLEELLGDLERKVEQNPLPDGEAIAKPGWPRFLICESAHRLLALELERVRSVDLVTEITPLPKSPSWLLGIVAARGKILPVFSLDDLLGSEGAAATRLVVVEGAHELVLAVAGVRGIAELGQMSPGGSGAWISSAARFGDDWIDVLGRRRAESQ